MRYCIYEDAQSAWLEPLTLTRPAFALRCGALHLYERHLRQFGPGEFGFWMRPELVALWRLEHPDSPVNDTDWLREKPTTWLNGRWLASPDVCIDSTGPHVGLMNGQVAYAVLPAMESPLGEDAGAWLEAWRTRLPCRAVAGAMLDYLWDVVDQNGTALKQDAAWFRAEVAQPGNCSQAVVNGPQEQFLVAPGAVVEPFVIADTRGGPVMIDRDAVIHSFTRLEGPCYVGPEAWIVGAKLRACSTIGPMSRIGGEVEASIVQGFSNKYHEGFLGHSYVGEWVNIAAATQTSDLRNDYGPVTVTVNGTRIATGKSKVGAYIGDHSKTGLGALLNTGSNVGAFANVLPAGKLLPQAIPSFAQTAAHGELREVWDLRKIFATASRVMQRRGKIFSEVHRDFCHLLFEGTASTRRQILREAELRRYRQSV